MNNINYSNLVFKGGGAKGSAYAGCIEVLADNGVLDEVNQVGGTSAGAITAALLAVGAGSEGLTESVKHTDFRNFVSDSWGIIGDVDRLVEGYGLHTGDGFSTILKQYFKRFAGNENITFQELKKLVDKDPKKYKQLSVIASDITNNCSYVFNAHNTPELAIWQAVRASMSIPLVFEPMKIKDTYYVDGGLAWNYPIDLYDQGLKDTLIDGTTPVRNQETLGFYLEPQGLYSGGGSFNESADNIHSIGTFASSLITFMYQSANNRYIHPEDKRRTVFVDDLGVSATDFSISEELVDELIASGKKATRDFLSRSFRV